MHYLPATAAGDVVFTFIIIFCVGVYVGVYGL